MYVVVIVVTQVSACKASVARASLIFVFVFDSSGAPKHPKMEAVSKSLSGN